MKTHRILTALIAIAIPALMHPVQAEEPANNNEVDLDQFEKAADKLHDLFGGGNSYSKVEADGPFLVNGSPGNIGTLLWVVTSDSRGKKPMSNQIQIALNRYFDSIDPNKISIESKGDNIKHGDRIVKNKAAVERSHSFNKGVLTFNQTINFRASWGHFNTGFPRTEIYVKGVIADDAVLKKQ